MMRCLGLLFALSACYTPVGTSKPLEPNTVGRCAAQCQEIGLALDAVVVMASTAGCVCTTKPPSTPPSPTAPSPTSSTSAAAAGMATIMLIQEAQQQQRNQSQHQYNAPPVYTPPKY